MRLGHTALTIVIVAAGLSAGTHAEGYPIGGSTPDRRPEGAPVIVEVVKDQAWYRQALEGITQPYPPHLQFLDDEGAWYTPFNHPGTPAPYDIRGWHPGG